MSRHHKNVDPETGKPILGDDLESEFPDFSDFEEEYERLSKENPKFATKEFQEFLKKRAENREK